MSEIRRAIKFITMEINDGFPPVKYRIVLDEDVTVKKGEYIDIEISGTINGIQPTRVTLVRPVTETPYSIVDKRNE